MMQLKDAFKALSLAQYALGTHRNPIYIDGRLMELVGHAVLLLDTLGRVEGTLGWVHGCDVCAIKVSAAFVAIGKAAFVTQYGHNGQDIN